jgi:hypothetical protein
MSEEDVRGGLRDAVVDEPPLVFDPDDLVAAARHQVKRRRALVAVGAATVAVAMAAVAIPLALGRGGSAQVADQPVPPSTVSSPSPSRVPSIEWPPPDIVPKQYDTAELRTRANVMAAHLESVVPAVLPTASDFVYGEFGGEAAGSFHEGQTYANAPVSFVIDGARYSIFVTVWVPNAPQMSPEVVCGANLADCEQVGEQDGGALMIKTEDLGDRTISTLNHFRATGSIVQIAAYNYDMADTMPTVYMPTIPVTLDQLKRLATDPELGL